MSKNVETVQQIYAAFGTGNVPAILERVRDDVQWENEGSGHGVAWLAPGRGRAHVAGFFQSLAAVDIKKFDVATVLGEGDVVVALVSIELLVRATGKLIRDPMEAHVWRFDPAGRVAAFCHCVDTHQHVLASRG